MNTARIGPAARADFARLTLWIAALAVIIAGAARFVQAPSFWLDEAAVAVSLREPSLGVIFAPLEYGQYFPRFYLVAIAALRQAAGYQIWSLRLIPFLAFIVATVFWARLLAQRSRPHLSVALIGGSLLIGASFWLDQAIQLKQYTLDVLLALVPFLLDDEFFEASLGEGKRKAELAALVLPVLLSYTYAFSLLARAAGWYLYRARGRGWSIRASSVVFMLVALAAALAVTWITDHRFNFKDRAAYLAYWNECILRARLQESIGGALRLLAKFFWGWHGRMPLVTAVVAPLQVLGVYSVVSAFKRGGSAREHSRWGSRSLCSLVLLGGMLAASVIIDYPICAGRVVLFTQVHTQLIAMEGALFILASWGKSRAARGFIYVAIALIAFHSVREFTRFARTEPAENIRPIVSLIDPEMANRVWVHPCSVAQVRSLPGALPAQEVVYGSDKEVPRRGDKVWIVWSHLGDAYCRDSLHALRSLARNWQVIHEDQSRGLALAEF